MGCVYGGILAKAGYDVTLIDVWAEHVKASENGLIINENGSIIMNIKAVTDPEKQICNCTVKATVTEQAMEGKPYRENTRVLTLQNGLGNIKTH